MMKHETSKGVNRRALPKFLLWVLLGCVVGAVAGFASGLAAIMGTGKTAEEWLRGGLTAAAPWGIPVSSLALLGACLALYRSARRLADGWDGEDEALPDRVDMKLNYVLLCSTLALVLDFFFLAAGTIYTESGRMSLLIVGEMLVSCALVIVAQQKVVDLTRRMNPEKAVSAYDTKFHEKWYEQCDEAERAQIGRASYRAYRVTGSFCLVLWVALLVLNYVFDFGLLPMAAVLAVWAVLQGAYILECIRMGRRGAR